MIFIVLFCFSIFALDNDVQVLVRSRPDNGGKSSKSSYKDMKSKKKNSGSKGKKGNDITQMQENSVSTADRDVAVGSMLSELSGEDMVVVMSDSTKRLQGDERIVDAIDERVERGDRGGEVGGDRTGDGGESSELLGLGGGKGERRRHLLTPQNVLEGGDCNHPTINHVTSNHPTSNHPTSNHPTSNHPTINHPTINHPTNNHPTSNHPTNNHLTSNHPTSNHPTNTTTIARVVEGEVIGERIGARPGGSFSVGVLPAPLASPKVRNINK